MNQVTIKIKNTEYIIKQSFRAYMLYEEMTGHQIEEIKSMKDVLTLLYCTLKGCNKSFESSFDEFIDLVDEDPTIFSKFNDYNMAFAAKTTEKKSKVKA